MQAMSVSRGEERSVEVQVGPLFGLDMRPTRVFMWTGANRSHVRILSFGRAPRPLRLGRRRRTLSLGPLHVTTLGNPIVTLGKTGMALAKAVRGKDAPKRLLR
jgi:hypothetical protein